MRVILVKPTNATQRLDTTGEVVEHYDSSGSTLPTQSSDGMCNHRSGTSEERSFPPQETSLCCISSPPKEKCNGICPVRVSGKMSGPKSQNLTLSQLSDQDWLLLHGQVSRTGDASSSAASSGSCVGHPSYSDRCVCSCLHAHQRAEGPSLHLQSKQGSLHDCLSRVPNRRILSSSPHFQPFSQSPQASNTNQDLPHETNLLKPTTIHPQDNFLLEGRKELLQSCDHCNHKESGQATLFNIPLRSIERAETNQNPQPAGADFTWRGLFGTEPVLVPPFQKQDPHCSVGGNPTGKLSGDPAIILNCRHLPYYPLTNTPKKLCPPASDKRAQSFATSQCSSLQNQDCTEEKHQQCEVIFC